MFHAKAVSIFKHELIKIVGLTLSPSQISSSFHILYLQKQTQFIFFYFLLWVSRNSQFSWSKSLVHFWVHFFFLIRFQFERTHNLLVLFYLLFCVVLWCWMNSFVSFAFALFFSMIFGKWNFFSFEAV